MVQNTAVKWQGLGRWLSLLGSALLSLFGVAILWVDLRKMPTTGMEAAAGWNLFLGLLLFGATVSGSKRAPILTLILAILMAVRTVSTAVMGQSVVSVLIGVALTVVFGTAAIKLRTQARAYRSGVRMAVIGE